MMEREPGPCIYHYFLRSNSSRLNEIQQLEPNQSCQDISPPAPVAVRSSTEEGPEEGVEPIWPWTPATEERLWQIKPKVNWPGTSEKAEQEAINEDLRSILEGMNGTVEKKLDMGGYHITMEQRGVG